jgi:hypothetical protein
MREGVFHISDGEPLSVDGADRDSELVCVLGSKLRKEIGQGSFPVYLAL